MASKKRKRDKKLSKIMAEQRIGGLFDTAQKAASSGDMKLAHNCMKQAWEIKLKFKITYPREYKWMVCRKCHHFLLSGENATYRVKKGVMTINCRDCGEIDKVPFK